MPNIQLQLEFHLYYISVEPRPGQDSGDTTEPTEEDKDVVPALGGSKSTPDYRTSHSFPGPTNLSQDSNQQISTKWSLQIKYKLRM